MIDVQIINSTTAIIRFKDFEVRIPKEDALIMAEDIIRLMDVEARAVRCIDARGVLQTPYNQANRRELIMATRHLFVCQKCQTWSHKKIKEICEKAGTQE